MNKTHKAIAKKESLRATNTKNYKSQEMCIKIGRLDESMDMVLPSQPFMPIQDPSATNSNTPNVKGKLVIECILYFYKCSFWPDS